MKVTLYMDITLDGYIARADDSTDYISDEDYDVFIEAAKRIGVMITGRRTYEMLIVDDILKDLEGVDIIVLSSTATSIEGVATASSPKQAIQKGQELGYDAVMLNGGASVNRAFLEQGLVDELFLDVEPRVLGQGIKLLGEGPGLDVDIQLLGSKKLSYNLLQLHYKVVQKPAAQQ